MKRLKILLAVMVSVVASALAEVWTPQRMVNPNIANRYEYIADPAHLMSRGATDEVNARLQALRNQTSVELMVALPPDIGDEPIEQWSEQLFTRWGIGKKDKDNGVLLVIAPEQRRTFIMTGYGVEGVLPDISCSNIISRAVIPAMRDGNIDKAVNDATSLMYDALTDPSVADELKSAQPDNYSGNLQALSSDVIWEFVSIIAVCLFLASLAFFIYDLIAGRKLDNYHKARMWRGHLKIYFWMGLFSLGAGLIFFLLALFIYRSVRTKRIPCPTCGAKMKRLSEEEDNELLSPSQDFEEKLNTVDYDVWECPKCGTIERFPYHQDQTKYTECPKCGTVAMCLTKDVITIPPTTRREGLGEKVYECQFCHHQKKTPYRIPRKDDGLGAAVAAGAVLGSMGRGGGGFGGGGFGGGLGGGATGGGGAGGSW